MSRIPARLRRLVVQRARRKCEYCQLSQVGQEATFHVDHVVPSAKGGRTFLRNLALAMATMADPSRLAGKRAEAIGRLRSAMNADPFMVAGTGRFCTRLNGKLGGTIQAKGGAEGVYCCMLPTLGLGLALKMWDGAGRASEVATATILDHLGLLPVSERDAIVHPPVKNVVGLLVGEMRPAKSWLG